MSAVLQEQPYTVASARITPCLAEALKLWRLHWEETEGYRHGLGFKPQLNQFVSMDEAGQFKYFVVRDKAGELVGHLGYLVYVGRHTGQFTATEDFLYLRPDHRSGFTALRLIKHAVAELLALGLKPEAIYMSSKTTHPIEPLLKRAHFKQVATFYQLQET